ETTLGALRATGAAVGRGDGLGNGDAARAAAAVAPGAFDAAGAMGRSAPHAAVSIATAPAATMSRGVRQDRPKSHASPADPRESGTARLSPRGSPPAETSCITRQIRLSRCA